MNKFLHHCNHIVFLDVIILHGHVSMPITSIRLRLTLNKRHFDALNSELQRNILGSKNKK